MEVQANKTCQVCFANQATHFCDCQDPPTIFCFDCSLLHSGKNRAIFHQIGPIAALDRNIEEYKRKHKALLKAAAELRKNVERIDQCCREIEDLIKSCADYLTEYGGWWVHHLSTEKEGLSAAIEAAVLETTHCLDQNTQPHSPLAWLLWTWLPQETQVITYSVTAPDLHSLLQTCISYQNNLPALCERSKPEEAKQDSVSSSLPAANSPPQPHAEEHKDTRAVQEEASQLVHVTSTFLQLYSFPTSTWGPQVQLKAPIQADRWSTWVILEDRRVFSCGGIESNSTYILALDGAVEEKASMKGSRSRHGVLALHSTVYVFGGLM